MPRVSVIIPTHNRPGDVVKAVQSVFAQTFHDLEALVVVDGGSPETLAALHGISDDRLTVIVNEVALGNAEARNVGIRAAGGDLIALLDDDDLWMPEKLRLQVEAFDARGHDRAIVCCHFRLLGETQDLVFPRRRPRAGEPISDYIFCRDRSLGTEGAIQTSCILAPRSLFEEVPFDKDLPRLVDRDWLLRAGEARAEVIFPDTDEVLSIYAVHDARSRVSHSLRWRWQQEWAEERRALFTDRSFAGFLLTAASQTASLEGQRSAFWPLLKAAYAGGRPSVAEVAIHAGKHAVPAGVEQRVASWLEKRGSK
ncbi:glycosyltransferase family 2 protein [Parvularcula sp. ZS-1/3]|uniref:Glycosyltransferase family 2 protein n=1 Tax=Parvularcula mediterranea TaxID=2732508 RepID=A0A7Y3W5I3_9PROT|nr:glycosyltransferase family 2 protein [Parvularcula mediterranea]NNU16644.1 glycosyltransferase family 2 protein [Parvularcula mediterranea]